MPLVLLLARAFMPDLAGGGRRAAGLCPPTQDPGASPARYTSAAWAGVWTQVVDGSAWVLMGFLMLVTIVALAFATLALVFNTASFLGMSSSAAGDFEIRRVIY
mmetsp:Transcript_25379/g.57020  ORF Transcript_25379/g.57020 Transcript_25379/m.57020 type:complete len:104 (-) Transcript_25379:168-479(-)